MAGVKYNYALDEQGRLVPIKQAYLERSEGHTFHCIGCGAGMIARLGEVRDWHFAHWHPLSLTIHQPIYPIGQGAQNIQATMNQAYDSVMSALEPQYQGFVENPDQ